MKYTISGDNLQFVNIEFQPGEMIYSEAGSMVYMSGNVRLETRASGGLWKGVKRMAMGESFFITNFYADGGTALVGFAGEAPGKIMAIDLRGGKNWIVQKTGFICAEQAVDLDIAFQKKLGAALFGGEGLDLAKLAWRWYRLHQRLWGLHRVHPATRAVDESLDRTCSGLGGQRVL